MGLTYFKRYRMEIDLVGADFSRVRLPSAYRFVEWSDALLDVHARTKYLSFRSEIDSNVFPCLGELEGCQRLMQEIRQKPGFLPGATWLAAYLTPEKRGVTYCGTVQGIRDYSGLGAIQNLGVIPEHRDQGLGAALLLQALAGFQAARLKRAFLEVTASNVGAIRLYQRLGFARARTVYKAVEVAYT